MLLGAEVDLAVGERAAVADDAAQAPFRRQHLAHRRPSLEVIVYREPGLAERCTNCIVESLEVPR
jgi:hypothetical protein